MKLLTPQSVRDTKATEQSLVLLRTQETNKLADASNRRLALAEADFNTMLARNRTVWANEEEEHAQRLKEMDAELKPLEERKKQALIPIEMYKKKADEHMNDAVRFIAQAKEKEANVDVLTEKLEEKLDEVADRELQVRQREDKCVSRETGIAIQQQNTVDQAARLSQAMQDFAVTKNSAEIDIYERKKALVLIDRSLVAKEAQIERRRIELEKWAIQLADERGTLERAFNRISP